MFLYLFNFSQNFHLSAFSHALSEMECKSTKINFRKKYILKKNLAEHRPPNPFEIRYGNILLVIRYFICIEQGLMLA